MEGAEKAAAELAKAITEAAAIFILNTGCLVDDIECGSSDGN